MGNTCTYCEDLGDKVSKRIATNTNFRSPVYHSRCRWSLSHMDAHTKTWAILRDIAGGTHIRAFRTQTTSVTVISEQ